MQLGGLRECVLRNMVTIAMKKSYQHAWGRTLIIDASFGYTVVLSNVCVITFTLTPPP